MNAIDLGKLDTLNSDLNLYIRLDPKGRGLGLISYKNLVFQYGEEQLTIPVEELFKKLKELFKGNKDE